MSYEIDYSELKKEEKAQKAIEDIKSFLPEDKFNALEHIFMSCINYRQFSFYCGFCGIQGYPVVAWWNRLRQICRDMSE